MASPTCLFNIIVTHIKLPHLGGLDPREFLVEITIKNTTIPITSSRINVTEFKDGFGTELNVQPSSLRRALEECGMIVMVKYNDQIIGTGQISFPKSITESINEDMPPLVHAETCRIERDGGIVGNLEVLCQFVMKCSNQPKPAESNCRRNTDRSIHQQDIMFIVSESQRCPNPCDPCLDALSPDDDDYIRLGKQNFETVAPKFAETLKHSPLGDSVCSDIKNMAKLCEQTVDSIFHRSGQPRPPKPPCRRPADLRYFCADLHQSPQEDFEGSSPIPCFTYTPPNQTQMPLPIDEMKNKKRFCHVCLANMSFLPKLATCPNCGIKPMPAIEKRPEASKLTADQILMEYLCQPTVELKKQSSECEESGCKCNCAFEKLCAYHRVLKQCSSFYREVKSRTPKKPSTDQEPVDNCDLTVEQENCRNFLGCVFSELCNINNITDIKTQADLDKECIQKTTEKRKRHKAHNNYKYCMFEEHKKPTKQSNKGFFLKDVKKKHRKPTAKGHKHCANQVRPVPRRHGWNWTSSQEARKYGWYPGAIRKPILKMMKFFLEYSPKNRSFGQCKKKEKERHLPILQMCKKNGEIFITLRPLNNPNVQMNPIVFKVVKSDLAKALSEIKKKLKASGYPKCTCHNTVMMCTCRHYLDKKHLEYAVQKQSKRHHIENCVDHLVLTDTSDSEMEFDFGVSPPVDFSKIPSPHVHRTVNTGTQFDKKDLKLRHKYPMPLSPYWRAYDCAAGDRYTGTAFGAPGETVFEDGVFGYGGGGPHGPSAAPGGKSKPAGVWGSTAGGPMRGGGRGGGGRGGGAQGGGGGGQGGPFGGPGGKGFPGAKPKPTGPSPPIPVRMPKRYIEGLKKAEEEKKAEVRKELEKRKKGIDLMKYLMESGAIAKPWNPNDPESKGQQKRPGLVVGPDGLTDAQRKRRALNQICIPPLDSMPRLGKGFDLCQCYQPCGGPQCCYPCCYC